MTAGSRARATWASWNCIKTERPDEATAAVCVSYWVNLLQNLPAGTPDLFVTLNPPSPPDAAKTVRRVQLAHPLFDGAAVAAQARVGGLQGSGGVYFCGAAKLPPRAPPLRRCASAQWSKRSQCVDRTGRGATRDGTGWRERKRKSNGSRP